MNQEKIITISVEDDGQRLDRWLKKLMPFDMAQKLIRKGAIRVDGKKTKPNAKIFTGQEVRIPPMLEKVARKKYILSERDCSYMRSLVIYDDGDLVAINKPSGIASQGGGDEKRHIDGMLEALPNAEGVCPRLIHRLDKETSGLLLLARSAASVRELGYMFKSREIIKVYLAVTSPAPTENEGSIFAPIGKVHGPIKDKMMIDNTDGKKAITDFIVLQRAAKKVALVAFRPKTGRTHQIRLHASEILQCPVLSDRKYGGIISGPNELEFANRLNLHAWMISLPHPVEKGKHLTIFAPLADDLKKSWKALGFDVSFKDNPFENIEL